MAVPSLREEILTYVTLCLLVQQRANKKTLCLWGIDPLLCDDGSPNSGQGNIVYIMSSLKFSIKPANQNTISRLGPLHSCQTFHLSHPGYDLLFCLALGISCHTFFPHTLFKKKFFPFEAFAFAVNLQCIFVAVDVVLSCCLDFFTSLRCESCLTRFPLPDVCLTFIGSLPGS